VNGGEWSGWRHMDAAIMEAAFALTGLCKALYRRWSSQIKLSLPRRGVKTGDRPKHPDVRDKELM